MGNKVRQLKCTLANKKMTKNNGGLIDLTKTGFLDGCYHVLTSRTTIYRYRKESFFSVSVKNLKDQNSPRYAAKFEYEMPNYQAGPRKVSIIIEIPVNGQPKATIEQTGQPKKEVTFTNNKKVEHFPDTSKIETYQHNTAVALYLTTFGRFYFNGNTLDMNIWQDEKCTPSTCDKLRGLCGTSNLNMKEEELKGIKTCPYTKPVLEVASQRVQTGSCPQLEGSIKVELEKEKAKCKAASFHEVFGQGSGNGMALKYGGEHFNSGIAGGMGEGNFGGHLGCKNKGIFCRPTNIDVTGDCCSGKCENVGFTPINMKPIYKCK